MSEPARKSPSRVSRRHHKADRLPPHLLDELRRRVVEEHEPYERVEAWLVAEGHPIGHSSLHRWHRFYRESYQRIAERAQIARDLVNAAGGDPLTVGNAASQEFLQLTLDMLLRSEAGDAPLDATDLARLGTALARLTGTATSMTREIEDRHRQRAAEAARCLKGMESKGQLSPQARSAIEQIFGLRVKEDDGKKSA